MSYISTFITVSQKKPPRKYNTLNVGIKIDDGFRSLGF